MRCSVKMTKEEYYRFDYVTAWLAAGGDPEDHVGFTMWLYNRGLSETEIEGIMLAAYEVSEDLVESVEEFLEMCKRGPKPKN